MLTVRRFVQLCCIFLLILPIACQRFESPKEQTGLDKDSHSYTNVGYPASKMIQAVQSIRGVKRVTTHYDGKRITMHVYVTVPKAYFNSMRRAVKDRVNQVAPLNPVHVIIQPYKQQSSTKTK
ncbi:hypothetical protein SAMN05444392_103221 [Seinonella peptonophila]|uniref:Sporulation lipoprotein YhcN/YlaJ (Spore_YhcN_YlaJ) n=1 Tax=Seinonella peptonophila TaxID=112248 RepID=A0A1M4WHC5_9BACL|nr:hypothetical protein [Seinonella peptonophila]SHE80595.1 hypothetical protein SAMN05444392_103221 [Seinonella peptonophila]